MTRFDMVRAWLAYQVSRARARTAAAGRALPEVPRQAPGAAQVLVPGEGWQ